MKKTLYLYAIIMTITALMLTGYVYFLEKRIIHMNRVCSQVTNEKTADILMRVTAGCTYSDEYPPSFREECKSAFNAVLFTKLDIEH